MMAPVTPNQAIDLIASGGYKLPFGRLNRYSVAMRPLARDTSSVLVRRRQR
jgi:hypothetical protein